MITKEKIVSYYDLDEDVKTIMDKCIQIVNVVLWSRYKAADHRPMLCEVQDHENCLIDRINNEIIKASEYSSIRLSVYTKHPENYLKFVNDKFEAGYISDINDILEASFQSIRKSWHKSFPNDPPSSANKFDDLAKASYNTGALCFISKKLW